MLSLAIPFIVIILVVWIPGLIVMLGFFRKGDLPAYAAAPFISVFLFSMIGEAFSRIGIFCSWASVFGTAVLISLAIAFGARVVRFFAAQKKAESTTELKPTTTLRRCLIFALYPCIGIVLVVVIFISNIYSPDSLAPLYDNMHHQVSIQAFLDSGQWRLVGASLQYPLDSDAEAFSSGGFYPSAWHSLCAMLSGMCSISAMAAANTVNGILIGVVFPCAIYSFLCVLFPENEKIVICGSFLSLAFAIFPWQFLIWGPLYSNLASLVLLPAVGAFFLRIFRRGRKYGPRIENVVMLILGIGSLVVSQTGAVFCLALLFVPYVIYLCSQLPIRTLKDKKPYLIVLFGASSCVLIVLLWFFFYSLDALQGVVQYEWPATRSIIKAIIGVVISGFSMVTPPQMLLSLFIFIGIFYLIKRKANRWLIWSYLLAATIYVICASTEGELKHILGGFWYTDTFRIAAMTAIFAIPLASAGLFCIIQCLWKIVAKYGVIENRLYIYKTVVAFLVLFVSVYLIYGPSDPINRFMGYQSAFNCIRGALSDIYGDGSGTPLDDKELVFLDEVKRIVGDDVVINVADDGSGLAYPTDGINVYYRHPGGYGDDSETERSIIIRNSLNEIASDPIVREVVNEAGAKYVLFLDHGQTNLHANNYYISEHYPDLWTGIESIDENTPGFELVLHEDDMYLYRIN